MIIRLTNLSDFFYVVRRNKQIILVDGRYFENENSLFIYLGCINHVLFFIQKKISSYLFISHSYKKLIIMLKNTQNPISKTPNSLTTRFSYGS